MKTTRTATSTLPVWTCVACHAWCDETPFKTTSEWVAPRGASERQFGKCVEIDPRWIVIATDRGEDGSFDPGSVRLYAADDIEDAPVDLLRAPDRRWPDEFGSAIDLDGDRLLIGAPGDSEVDWDCGAAWLFEHDGAWRLRGGLISTTIKAGDRFGDSVALDGEWAAVGAPRSDRVGMDAGAVHLFHFMGGRWVETEVVVAPDASVADFFGDCVVMKGDWMAVGAWGDDDHGEKTGAVWVFHLEGARWLPVQKIVPPESESRNLFGCSLALIEGWMMVGSSGWNSNQGAIHAYQLDGSIWKQHQKLEATGGTAGEWLGHALSMRKDLMVAGAPGRMEGDRMNGRIDLFRLRGGRWTWLQRVRPNGDRWRQPQHFGWTVSTDGRRVLVGRIDEADGPAEAGRVWIVEKEAPSMSPTSTTGGRPTEGVR